jgi:hypothetical protein
MSTFIELAMSNLNQRVTMLLFIIILKWGTQPLHRRDAYSLLLFHLFNKDWQEALQQSYKLKPSKKMSKHQQTSANARGLDKVVCLVHRHRRLPSTIQRKRLVHKLQRSPPPLSASPSPEC